MQFVGIFQKGQNKTPTPIPASWIPTADPVTPMGICPPDPTPSTEWAWEYLHTAGDRGATGEPVASLLREYI